MQNMTMLCTASSGKVFPRTDTFFILLKVNIVNILLRKKQERLVKLDLHGAQRGAFSSYYYWRFNFNY